MNTLHQLVRHVKQVWLADDATGCGKLIDLVEWWKLICEEGRKIGYFVKESKSWLILKVPQLLDEAMRLSASSNINSTTEGKRHLGAVVMYYTARHLHKCLEDVVHYYFLSMATICWYQFEAFKEGIKFWKLYAGKIFWKLYDGKLFGNYMLGTFFGFNMLATFLETIC